MSERKGLLPGYSVGAKETESEDNIPPLTQARPMMLCIYTSITVNKRGRAGNIDIFSTRHAKC